METLHGTTQPVYQENYQLTVPKSFFVGWTNIAGWLTIVTTQAFFAGRLLDTSLMLAYILTPVAQLVSAAAVVASNNAYEATAWKTYLFFIAILSFGTAGNIWGNRILGRWNDLACKKNMCL
jgi:hypothetical protein